MGQRDDLPDDVSAEPAPVGEPVVGAGERGVAAG